MYYDISIYLSLSLYMYIYIYIIGLAHSFLLYASPPGSRPSRLPRTIQTTNNNKEKPPGGMFTITITLTITITSFADETESNEYTEST